MTRPTSAQGDVGCREGEAKRLSPREAEILALLTLAYGEKQIAEQLGLSQHTVHVYVKSLYRRYNVHTRAELLVAVLSVQPNPRFVTHIPTTPDPFLRPGEPRA